MIEKIISMLQILISRATSNIKCFRALQLILVTLLIVSCGVKTSTKNESSPVKTETVIADEIDTNSKDLETFPFAVIDNVPVYPGCESYTSNEEQMLCFSRKIEEFAMLNFNTGLAQELKLTGVNRIIILFKIDKQGDVTDIKVRAPHPKLEEEARRVIQKLPKMTPGKQNGKAAGVMYSLPIVFEIHTVNK